MIYEGDNGQMVMVINVLTFIFMTFVACTFAAIIIIALEFFRRWRNENISGFSDRPGKDGEGGDSL